MPPSHAWTSPTLDGAIYAHPVVYAGLVIVATENDSLYGLSVTNGHILWGPTTVGTPVPRASLPCGNIFPLGITGTPVVDPATGTVYAVAERTTAPDEVVSHDLVALDARTGTKLWQHSIDPSGLSPQNRRNQQQRPALVLANGRLYVAFGGLFGDCGQYWGWVVSARADGTGSFPLETYQVPTPREGAIWGTAGPAVDAAGNLYVATGNGESTDTAHYDHGNSIIKLAPDLHELDHFAPRTWASDSAADLDLGSTSPTLLANGLVFQAGKSGTAYLLDANHLGGIGGELYSAKLCRDFGANAYADSVLYVPCTDGVRAVKITGTTTKPSFTALWHSPAAKGTPVVAGGAVWSSDDNFGGSTLYGLDPTTGATIATLKVGELAHFAAATVAGDHLLVAAADRVLAFTGPTG